MKKFKPGDVVQIKKESEYFNLNRNNPGNTNGRIVDIDFNFGPFYISVKWDNEESNFYRKTDLELAESYLQQQEAKKLLGLKDV